MMVPKYMPDEWVVFAVDENRYLGQIKAAVYMENNGTWMWIYSVSYGDSPSQSVTESSITHFVENGGYVAVAAEQAAPAPQS